MAELKPFASLSSGLLARKGAAKPAMRPQGFGQMGVSLEDLGWNDMGHQPQPAPSAPVHASAPLAPAPEPIPHVPAAIAALTRSSVRAMAEPEAAPEEAPAVVEQQRAIEASFAPQPRKARIRRTQGTVTKLPRNRRGDGAGGKAAFTLRLDGDRHLRLRLACAVTNRSAQLIVTEALDEFLDGLPELDAMARHASGGKRN